jgi:hypothetical protein
MFLTLTLFNQKLDVSALFLGSFDFADTAANSLPKLCASFSNVGIVFFPRT